MKTIALIIIFCSLFLHEVTLIQGEVDNEGSISFMDKLLHRKKHKESPRKSIDQTEYPSDGDDEKSPRKSVDQTEYPSDADDEESPRASYSLTRHSSGESISSADTDRDFNIKSTPIKRQNTRKDSMKKDTETDQRVPNVFQKIRVPIGGPYCYPEILDTDVNAEGFERRRTRYTYSPQLPIESSEGNIIEFPSRVRAGDWPYEPDQDKRKKEIRKYIKLNISPERNEEDYRFTGRAAERAFISRYYGFINPSKNEIVDALIKYIEDSQKESNYKALSTEPDPLAEEPEFNLWSDKEKSDFCDLYVNYSIMLYDEKIDFDPSYPERIIRKLAKVKYNHPYLEKFKDTDEVVICPCIDISSDTPIDLGVSPIRYKYKQEFLYAFIYDILENSNDEDVCTVNVKALTKVDFRGMKKKRELRDKEQKYKRKQMDKQRKRKQEKEKEDEETKQDDTDSDNEEAQNPDLFKKLLSLVSFRGKE